MSNPCISGAKVKVLANVTRIGTKLCKTTELSQILGTFRIAGLLNKTHEGKDIAVEHLRISKVGTWINRSLV